MTSAFIDQPTCYIHLGLVQKLLSNVVSYSGNLIHILPLRDTLCQRKNTHLKIPGSFTGVHAKTKQEFTYFQRNLLRYWWFKIWNQNRRVGLVDGGFLKTWEHAFCNDMRFLMKVIGWVKTSGLLNTDNSSHVLPCVCAQTCSVLEGEAFQHWSSDGELDNWRGLQVILLHHSYLLVP